ncbi:MAG: transcriptional repressor LexA [Candidatus Xenobiia bacterium LiM19]
MSQTVTQRQKAVFDFIVEYARENGYPPTIREIALHFRIVSLNAVRMHLKALERKKLITLEHCSRGIHINTAAISDTAAAGLPLAGRIAAGSPIPAIENRDENVVLDASFWGSGESFFLLRIKGGSMDPELKDGDYVVVKPQSYASLGDIVVAIIDGEATVKELARKNSRIFLRALNYDYDDIYPEGDFTINGKVVGVIRRYQP